MLTRKQYELLTFIHERLQSAGVSPSFDEMKDALDLKSKSGIHRLITALEERGFIRRLAHRARALEVLRLPEDIAQAGALAPLHAAAQADHSAAEERKRPGFVPNVIHGNFREALPSSVGAIVRSAPPSVSANAAGKPADGAGAIVSTPEFVELPVYGRIAAGTPIEALRHHDRSISMPVSLLGAGEHYALEVAGDSMIDAGINDSDTVIIRRCETAENGAIVVALIDDNEVTLKRLRRKGDSIALEPANPAYETRIFGPDRVQIQGRLVTLIRNY